MKKAIALLLLLFSSIFYAQVRGTVTDTNGIPLALVSVLVENTYNGTSSNEQGQFELNLKNPGKYNFIFQHLGYKTQKITVEIKQFPFVKNIQLTEENLALQEVVINTKENPANAVIRNAIKNKKQNAEKTGRYKADFYSRGIFKVKDLPKKIMGQEIGDLDGQIDSTGSGIIYLSETVSKIIFEKPNNLKERITASKVSGNNKGFSYNTAISSAYDFYDNSLDFGAKIISPIADNAFNYYKFKLEGTFQDENNQMINKIKVIAKRDAEPVFEGYIYIVEDVWAIYAIDLDVKGYRMGQEIIDIMKITQNFGYNKNTHIWSKNTQSRSFTAGLFGIKFSGKFSYVYTNYEFQDSFDKKTFSNEIVSFEENSNKKDSVFWNKTRPIPLTKEESVDYIKKDSVYEIRNSKKYLDSIDKKNNKFKILDLIEGYQYSNSYQNKTVGYDGLIKIGSIGFNTVQGWNLISGFNYRNTKNEEKGIYTRINSIFNYGFSEDRLRVSANYLHQFNNQNYARLSIFGGTKVSQFNPEEPITNLVNTISTLLFRNNFMKLYNNEFFGIQFGKNIANGVNLRGKLEYEQRKALFNNTDYSIVKSDDLYTSNNPQNPLSDLSPAFPTHHLTKFNLYGKINFGNKYITRPDGKINFRTEKYPTLSLNYENAFAASEKKYEFQLISTRVTYEFTASNKGTFSFNLKAGKFINAKNIAFMDYKHFNGNQTHFVVDYLNAFNLLPYYTDSKNDAYSENHFAYNDNGFIMNKLPLLNLLKSKLVLGYHNLLIPNTRPYSEFSVGLNNLGFGKFRFFRIDYVRSYQNGYQGDGVVFGFRMQ